MFAYLQYTHGLLYSVGRLPDRATDRAAYKKPKVQQMTEITGLFEPYSLHTKCSVKFIGIVQKTQPRQPWPSKLFIMLGTRFCYCPWAAFLVPQLSGRQFWDNEWKSIICLALSNVIVPKIFNINSIFFQKKVVSVLVIHPLNMNVIYSKFRNTIWCLDDNFLCQNKMPYIIHISC